MGVVGVLASKKRCRFVGDVEIEDECEEVDCGCGLMDRSR